MKQKYCSDTIVAISTPAGEGGIGIVRLSGPEALKIADSIFRSPGKIRPSRAKSHTLHYGHIYQRSPDHGPRTPNSVIDQVLLTVMRAPRTYTKEDIVEINCHGGQVACRRIAERVLERGARIAEPGEFTKRAFLNGRLDLSQAEAVLDVIKSKTEEGLRASVGQLEGRLSDEIRAIRGRLLDLCSDVEASIDFPDEDIEAGTRKGWLKAVVSSRKSLEELVRTYHDGMVLKEGLTAVICGRANVGKSSLMNLLLKRDRVIVTHVPGTTRDAIEELVSIKGIPVRLVDTAGIRKQKGLVETQVDGQRVQRAQVTAALCTGCGACVAVCPQRAIDINGWTLEQYEAMVDRVVADEAAA